MNVPFSILRKGANKIVASAMALMLALPVATFADSDVTAELRDQNTPSGWTAVSLPTIPEITSSNTITITDAAYGASTSSTDNTTAIQAALDAVPSTGGMVVVPAGTFLCGPITVKSKTVLHLAEGATLKLLPYGNGTDGKTATPTGYYPTNGTNSDGKYNYQMFLTCTKSSKTTDIIVEGEGTTSVIDGQGSDWWDKRNVLGTRPPLIRFEKGSKFLFRNFKLLNSPGVNLTLGNGGGATDFTVHDITISNPSSSSSQLASGEVVSHNTDGIPIWGARCNIYNCNISTGDDNIVTDSHAQYIHVWNVKCGYGHGMSMGSYTEQMNNIIYEGITFTNTSAGFRLKTCNGRSGNDQSGTDSNGAVKNIICRNSTMTGVAGPIKITSWYDDDPSDPTTCSSSTITYQTPEFCDITFQNIQSTGTTGTTAKSNSPIYLYGRPEIYVHNITFDNVQISSQLGMFLAYCNNINFTNGCKITNTKSVSTLVSKTVNASTTGKYDGSESATTYAVKFMNGSSTYATQNICANSYAYPPTAPTKSGYTFKGWATAEGGTAVSLAATQLSAGGTYYALWESTGGSEEETGTDISLRFTSSDVASGISTNTIYCTNFTVGASSSKTVEVANSSKTIDGESFSDCLKFGGTGSNEGRYISFPVTGNCSIKVYGVSASSSVERSLTIASGTTALGTALKTDLCKTTSTPVAETYSYSGDATTIYIYSTNSGYNVYGIDVTYPTSSTTYTVSYNLNGHGDAISDVTGVTTLPATLPTPTADGYTFGGWFTDSGLTTQAVAGATISANTTLYAKWTANGATGSAKTFTFLPTDGTTTGSYVRTSVENPSFSLTSSKKISSDSRFKLVEGSDAIYTLNIPSNATVSKVVFTNCSENYYNNPSGSNTTTTFIVASSGATVNTVDANSNTLQYLSTGQTITSTITGHVTGTPITFVANGGSQLAFGSIQVYYVLTNTGSLGLLSQSVANNATVTRSGKISFTFDNDVTLASGATIKIDGTAISTEVSGPNLIGYYTGLEYGSSHTATFAANGVSDEFGNSYATALSVPFTINARTAVTKAGFDAIVSTATELDAAIAAANSRSDKTTRYRIFIKNGNYVLAGSGESKTVTVTLADKTTTKSITYANPTTYLSTDNVSFIGQSMDGVVITNKASEIETYEGQYGTACAAEGIGNGDVLDNSGTSNYFQGLTMKSSMGDSRGRDVVLQDKGNKTIFKDACLWGYQDTYTSNNTGRFYFEGGVLRGRTDYLCGKGDVYYNEVTLQQCGTGGYLAVPSQPLKYGYIFNNCYIKKETSDVTYYLGRPWGQGTPIALYINTKVDAAPLAEGWAEMSGGWPNRFAEYNTKTTSGSTVDTSSRKTTFNSTYTNSPILTADEATYYSNMTRILSGSDGWDPTEYTEQCAQPTASISGTTLSWTDDSYASSWIVFKDGSYYANPTTNSLTLTESGSYTVRAANYMGGLGTASAAVTYVDTTNGGAALSFTASVQGGSNTAGSYVNQETHYYNNWGISSWVAQAYLGFNVTVPEGKQISSATLKFTSYCGGSKDGRTVDVYLLDKTTAASFDTSNMSLSTASGTSISSQTDNLTESLKTISFTSDNLTALNNAVTSGSTVPVVFQLGNAAAGAYVYGYGSSTKAPTLVLEFENAPTTTQYTVTATATNGTVAIKNGDTEVTSGTSVDDGTSLTFTATPADGYKFTQWSDGNTDNPRTVTVDGADVTLTAEFTSIITSHTVFYDAYAKQSSTISASACPSDQLEGITITYGTSEWTVASGGITCGDDAYSGCVSASSSGSYKNYSITAGAITLRPLYSGTIDLAVVVNSDKAFYICDETGSKLITDLSALCYYNSCFSDNTPKTLYYNTSDYKLYDESSCTTKHKLYGTVTFSVEAGHKYSIGVAGSKMGLYGFNYEYTTNGTTTVASVASGRTFGSFSSSYNVDFSDVDGTDDIAAYTVKYNEGTSSVKLTRHQDILPAGTGVVLYAPTDTKSQVFSIVSSADGVTVADNDMVGVPVATAVASSVVKNSKTYYNYGLSVDAFHPISAGTMPAGKAYLSITRDPSASSAKAITLSFDDDILTGIGDTQNDTSLFGNGKIYNLQGIEVSKPEKGKIYIINNKKITIQ